MRRLVCTSCGATLEWDGVSPVVTCASCGSRFQMNVGGEQDGSWRAAALRGGCVAERPCLDPQANQGRDFGKSYYRCWLPQGWTYQVLPASLDRAGSSASPLVPTIAMYSPDSSTIIVHTSSNVMQDAAGTGAFAAMFGAGVGGGLGSYAGGQIGMDGLIHFSHSTLDPQTFVRFKPMVGAAQDCDEIAQLDHSGAQLVAAQEADDLVTERVNALLANAPEQLRQSYLYDWARRIYRFVEGGVSKLFMVEAQVSTTDISEDSDRQSASGGFFGRMLGAAARGMAQKAAPRTWQIDYEMSLTTPEADFDVAMQEYERVRRSIELGRDFAQMQAFYGNFMAREALQNQQMTSNAMMQMQAARAASWDRMSATIADAQAHTTSVMRQMNANTAATHDRVAGWHSESIRGVNTYAGAYGPVEANVQYDHVYQGVPGSGWDDTYVATEGDWLEPGMDFVELPRS